MDFSPCWKCFWDMVEASKCLCSSFFGHFHNLCLKEDTCVPDYCFCYFLILTSGAHMRAPRGLSLSRVKLCWMILLEFWVMWHIQGRGLEKFKHISLATARMGLQMHCPQISHVSPKFGQFPILTLNKQKYPLFLVLSHVYPLAFQICDHWWRTLQKRAIDDILWIWI